MKSTRTSWVSVLVMFASLACGPSEPDPAAPGDAAPDALGAGGNGGGSGTSDGGNDPSLPPIDPSRDIATLTTAEKGQLCDWKNAVMGGYGVVHECGGFTASTDPDRAACVGLLNYRCKVTVVQYETCIPALAANKGCVLPVGKCDPLGC